MTKPALQSACGCLLGLCIAAPLAGAAEITGSFTGRAVNSFVGMYPAAPGVTNFNGAPITGSFDVVSSGLTVRNADPLNYLAYLSLGDSRLTFSLVGTGFPLGQTYSYRANALSGISGALFTTTSSAQMVSLFSENYGDEYESAGISFAGPDLFSVSDPTVLNREGLDLAASTALTQYAFGQRFQFGTGIDFTSVTFGATPIPEPSTLPLMVGSLAFLVFVKLGSRWLPRIALPA